MSCATSRVDRFSSGRRQACGAGSSTPSPIPEAMKPASRLYEAIKRVAAIDQGTGSTFAVLADRGLVHVRVGGPDVYTHVRATTAGRKLVRSWTGQKAYKAPPPGTLKEWHRHALGSSGRSWRQGP